jgi:cyclopropane-fatty-acyl-phospholipid synthase
VAGRDGVSPVPRPLAAFCRSSTGGSIGLGLGYAEGLWDVPDLVGLLRRLFRWTRPGLELSSVWANVTEPLRLAPIDSVDGKADQRHVAHHYDLLPEFFALFLSPDMSYSCAWYESAHDTLAIAAARKIERVGDALGLTRASHLLDVGAGWGALSFAAATRWGARVTAVTLSMYQYEHMRQQVERRSLGSQVTVVRSHYDDLAGSYDAMASIEMIEALDWPRHRHLLTTCRRVLAPRGIFVLQAITIADRHFHRTKRHEELVKRFIFPGGCLPSRRSLMRDVAAAGFEVVDAFDLSDSYGPTLAAWRNNLDRNWRPARDLGLSEGFLRMWRFYLAYCEAGFREGYLGDHQLVLRHAPS